MAFWDDIGQKASETTAKAVQKAKDMTDVAKLNSMISDEETKINNAYYQIGKLYVTMHAQDCEEEFTGMVSVIVEADEKIKKYRQQIQDIKGVVRCSQCGAEVPAGGAFCSSCGAPLPKVQPAGADDLMKCGNCGAMIKKGTRFCTSCGTPIAQMAVPEPISAPVIESEVQNRVCPNCGTPIKGDVMFCVECGTKL